MKQKTRRYHDDAWIILRSITYCVTWKIAVKQIYLDMIRNAYYVARNAWNGKHEYVMITFGLHHILCYREDAVILVCLSFLGTNMVWLERHGMQNINMS